MSKQRVRICNKENVRPGDNDSEQKIQENPINCMFFITKCKRVQIGF